MKTSSTIEKIIVDANPIISALIKGAASRVFWSRKIKEFITTEFTINEVRSYVPLLAYKAKTNEETIVLDFSLLPLIIISRDFYFDHIEEARKKIGKRDKNDIELLALALKLNIPVWTNDRDFEETGILYYPTAKLLTILGL